MIRQGVSSLIALGGAISDFFGKAVSWLNPLLILLIMADVFGRYFLQRSAVWIGELEWMIFAAMFLLGAAYTMNADQHVRVDVFYQKWSPKRKALINLLGHACLMLPLCLFLIPPAWDYALRSWEIREASGDPGGMAAIYPVKTLIPLAFVLLLIQSVAEILSSLRIFFPSAADQSLRHAP